MCFIEPTAGAIVTTLIWNRTKDSKIGRLNLLFWGGALFGLIDHFWNGELFVVPKNLISDLWLGAVITVSILVVWKVMLSAEKTKPEIFAKTRKM